MYGFGAYGQYAYGEVPLAARVVQVTVGLAVLAAPAGRATTVEHPVATMSARASEATSAKVAETARAPIAAKAGAAETAQAAGSRSVTVAAKPSIASAATQIEYVLRDVRTIRAPGAFGEMAFGQGSRIEIFRTGVAFGAIARAADAATSKVREAASLVAAAGETASPHAHELAAVALASKDVIGAVPGIVALRGATVGAKAGLTEIAASIERGAAALAAAFAAASSETAREHTAATLGTVAAERGTSRGIEEAAVVLAAVEGISDRAPAEREPVIVVGMAVTASLTPLARAIANRALSIATLLGEAVRATHNAPQVARLDAIETILPAEAGTGHGHAPLDMDAGVIGAPRSIDLLGLRFDVAGSMAGIENATTHGRVALGATEQFSPHPGAAETAHPVLGVVAGETARATEAQRAHGAIAAIAAAAGRFSVSIRARTLSVIGAQAAAPAAVAPAHANLATTAGSSSATPSPRSRRIGQIVSAFGVLPALLGSERIAASLSLLAAWSARRFFDLRLARKLFGRGSRASFTGSAARAQITGRAAGGTFTGSEL